MLAGKAPFPGEKMDDLFWQICNKEPEPLKTHVAGIPAELEGVVSKALAKDRRQRYQTAGELLLDLKAARSKLESPVAESGISKKLLAAVLLTIVIIGLGLWIFIPRGNPSPTPTVPHVRFLENLPIKDGRVSFSPDGRQIAFSSGAEGEQNIWIRNLEGGEARPVTNGKFSDRYPIWSPDGQRLAFVSDRGGTNAIWLVSSLGGRPARLLAIEGASVILIGWSKQHQRLYAEIRPNLFAVDLSPPGLIQLTNFDASRLKTRNFSVSPQEDFIAYSALIDEKRCILKAPIGRDEPQQVTQGEGGEDRSPSWLPDGKDLIYNSRRGDVYQLFIAHTNGAGSVPIAVSDNDYESLQVSPDGASIITVSRKEKGNIFLFERKDRNEIQLTSDFVLQLYPEVSRDGERFLFHSSNASTKLEGSIMVGFTRGGRQPTQIVSDGIDAKWAPDGQTLAIARNTAGSSELWKVRAVEKNETRLTTRLLLSGRTGLPYSFLATNFSWAPSGDRIAYASAESGRRNLRVVSSDGSTDTVLTTSNDDKVKLTSPFWSRDGNRLAYVSEPLSYTAVGSRSLCVVEQGKTRTLFTSATQFRLLGWTKSDKEVCVAVGDGDNSDTLSVKLYRIPVAGGPPVTIAEMAGVFLHSIKLSEDGLSIAFVSRQDGKDNIGLVSWLGGPPTMLTSNSDATARYSGLTWSSDGKMLFYSKQTSWSVASLIRNFK
jgi:Tol biopolymer transport system component